MLWSELFPDEFRQRLEECPLVYLPLGICEPHGQISAYGLDTIKAEYLCAQAARRGGGIVAPSLGYHIHEAGYHAPWLRDEVGEINPHMTAMPPHVMLYFFLYQLRAFVNAGFKGIIVVSGHSGGNQEDLRRAAELFQSRIPVAMWVGSDPELVRGLHDGDHAGKYEISQLMYLRPDLIDESRRELESLPGSGGRLALGADAGEASSQLGERIMEDSLLQLGEITGRLLAEIREQPEVSAVIDYAAIESIYAELLTSKSQWRTASPYPAQEPVPEDSRWKPYEFIR
ncbi:creatininase family protein [Paenibacillus sepulcri]